MGSAPRLYTQRPELGKVEAVETASDFVSSWPFSTIAQRQATDHTDRSLTTENLIAASGKTMAVQRVRQ
jgi:hypothetical protein